MLKMLLTSVDHPYYSSSVSWAACGINWPVIMNKVIIHFTHFVSSSSTKQLPFTVLNKYSNTGYKMQTNFNTIVAIAPISFLVFAIPVYRGWAPGLAFRISDCGAWVVLVALKCEGEDARLVQFNALRIVVCSEAFLTNDSFSAEE